jgi:hypothetical protein
MAGNHSQSVMARSICVGRSHKVVMNPILTELVTHPYTNFAEIARTMDVSRERVRQIAKKNNFVSLYTLSRKTHSPICPQCKGSKSRKARLCQSCYFSQRRQDQRRSHHHVECSICGKPLVRTPSRFKRSKSGLFFCAKGEGNHDNLSITVTCPSCGQQKDIQNTEKNRWAIEQRGRHPLCSKCVLQMAATARRG